MSDNKNYTGKKVFNDKKKTEKTEDINYVNNNKMSNLIGFEDYTDKKLSQYDAKKTKRTDVAKDIIKEGKNGGYSGKEVFKDKDKNETKPKGEDINYVNNNKMSNLVGFKEYTDKNLSQYDASKTKRTDVAKDVIREKEECKDKRKEEKVKKDKEKKEKKEDKEKKE